MEVVIDVMALATVSAPALFRGPSMPIVDVVSSHEEDTVWAGVLGQYRPIMEDGGCAEDDTRSLGNCEDVEVKMVVVDNIQEAKCSIVDDANVKVNVTQDFSRPDTGNNKGGLPGSSKRSSQWLRQ